VLTLAQWQQHDPAAVAAFLAESQGSAGEQAAKYAQDAVRDQGAQIVAFNSRQAELLQQPPSALERLNLAFFEDGVVIHLADDTRLDEPVYVVHQWNAAAAQRMNHPRVIVRAGRNSHCTLIEHFLGPDEAEYFTNAVTTADLAEGATLTHYRLQLESLKSFHIGHIQARLQAHSRYACHDIALGASLGRMNLRTELHGAGAHAALHGLFVPMGTQHLDTHTRIDHIAAHTTSEEDYRGVAAGRGRGVFNGKVIVHPGAQKIDARQSSRNLLLSPGAEIDTKPELEIYADDVKCSHGATTGQLDATALFYLRSRGLSETQARSLLIRAFAESILSTIEHAPLRSHLERHLDRLFAVSHEARP
jgi:Fe-S cluster assembly protein SufD